MMKNGVIAEKKDNKLSFYSFSETFGRNYLYTKPFTQGEWRYFQKARSMNELYGFRRWGRNPRLDKTVKRVIQMQKYVEKEIVAWREEVEKAREICSRRSTYSFSRETGGYER